MLIHRPKLETSYRPRSKLERPLAKQFVKIISSISSVLSFERKFGNWKMEEKRKRGEEMIKLVHDINCGGVISPGDLSICHRERGRGIRDYSPKKYGPIYGPVGSLSGIRASGRILRACGHTYVWSRGAAHILYKVSPIVPSPSRRIAWIPVRGRRVNISPHVKPRAGKNVSTWVPCLVLDAPFAPFLPRPSPSLPYLSIFRRGRLPPSFARPEESSRGEETRGERSGTRWMDRSLFLRGV